MASRPRIQRSRAAGNRAVDIAHTHADREVHGHLAAATTPLDAYALARLTGRSAMECAWSLRRLQDARAAATVDAQDRLDDGMSCGFSACAAPPLE